MMNKNEGAISAPLDRLVIPFIDSIVCGDNVMTMNQLPDACIDLTVTSPPYDNLRIYGGQDWNFETVARELFRITKQGGVVVWVVGDATINGSETGTSFKQGLFFIEIGFKLHDTMIYEKSGFSNPARNRYHQVFEYMFILSKNTPKTFNGIKDRKNIWDRRWGIGTTRNKAGILEPTKEAKFRYGEKGLRFNIWRYNSGGMNMISEDDITYKHPAPFPERLASDHIESWSNKGDVILDPFSGSGTTCKIAKKLRRHWIGIEINSAYIEISNKRMAQEVLCL
jgi:site-specific DNA-methyltransferase (adenine-specific)